MKRMTALILMGAMMFSLTACGGSKSEAPADNKEAAETQAAGEEESITCTMLVWSPSEDQSPDYGNWLQTQCEAFNEAHPNWDITFEYGVASEAEVAKIATQDIDSMADVFMMANDQLTDLLPAQAVARLGGETETYVKDTNSETMVDSVTVDGALYGIPFTSNTWFMYYDKSVFTEDDIKSLDTMLEKGKVSFPFVNSWYVQSFYVGNGCTFFEDGKNADAGIDFTGDKATAVTDYLIDLLANPNFVIDDDGAGLAGLRDGSVNVLFSGSWNYDDVKEALGDNMGIAQLPCYTLNGEEVQMYSFSGSKAMAVSSTTEYPQVAVALARYLASPEAQMAHYEARNIIPCNEELLQDEALQSDMLVAAQNDTVANTSIVQPFIAPMANYWTPTENFAKSIRNGEVTHDNAAEATAAWNENMNTELVSQ